MINIPTNEYEILIGKFESGDENEISELIRTVYDEFVAPDYSAEGNLFFYDWIEPARIAERQRRERTIYTAKHAGSIVGVIETRDNNRISLLFVDKNYQGKGIARRLFVISLTNSKVKNEGLSKYYVHASPFSIPIYQNLGFRATGEMQENSGIKYLPMEYEITE